MVFTRTTAEWEKRHGHAGKNTIRNMCIQLEHAGWKRGDWTTGGIPDGSAVANSETYTSPDGRILMSYYEYYGVTAYDNSYSIRFELVGEPVVEDSEDDINPKFTDLRDAFDKIDERGFQWRSGKWRIRLDDIGTEYKIYYDPEGWIASIDYNRGKYDLFNNKVVAKNEVDDFLHALGAEGFMPMDMMNESSRFGFKVGDKVALTKDKSNQFSGDFIPAGTQGEVVAIDKPMPGVIKVKIEDWKVISVPERQLRMADDDEEPWRKLAKKPKEEPKRDIRPEKPEDHYMRPTTYGSPRFTGD